MTPTELIRESKQEQIDNVWTTDRKVRKHLLSFLRQLRDEGKTHKTFQLYMGTVRTFYHEYDIDLPRLNLKNNKKNLKRQTITDIPTKEHIRLALDFCDHRYKAIILFMASTGMASVDVRNVTIQDFYNSLELSLRLPVDLDILKDFIKDNPGYCPIFFNLNRVKTGIPFTTFCTPEALKYIVHYIGTRKQPYLSGDDKLFHGFEGKYGNNNFERQFRIINDSAGFGWNGRSRFFTSHKLRKFFASTLYSSNLQELKIHWFMGHIIPESTESYFKANVKTHRLDYMRLVPDLTFTEKVETKTIESEEFKSLKSENEELRAELDDINSKLADLGPLAKVIENPKVKKIIEEELSP
jgi:integrase